MTKSVDYMHSQGKRESEPVLGAGGFFTAGMRALAKRPQVRRKRGVGTSTRDLHTFFLMPCQLDPTAVQLLEGSIPQHVI
jgi:hypothetical protein